ncbi:NAD(P)/FAD-dependent oxidoreductase [Jannaschia sp. S6380]|uniref:NAD(P)/FAD-dependent oxidoreductase n=1 Tax=Jannaschia sp. S6380 TaxID=2926408 RepID=UPI001FF249DB|nr:NAD(P)/FAD-dependent oxidoreductase [Jannaschia sp. S6380]MCK0167333.1 NAD(P)/FAD-dependent oxidoreductase [Jannaschia sp. S6380]
MSLDRVQTVVVGSGVTGLAIARALARDGHEVLILEAEESGFHHTSARNSQVIHAGFAYPVGSLKARLCRDGRARLYDFCRTRGVDHAACGKLVVATEANQMPALAALVDRGAANGVEGMRPLSGEEAARLEPRLRCHGAVLVPSSGVVDAVGLMHAILGEAQADGAVLARNARLVGVHRDAEGYVLEVGDAAGTRIAARNLVNAAGLGAWDVARALADPAFAIPHQSFVKACYFSLGGAPSPFARLIYPAPGTPAPAVHALRDFTGQARIGPGSRIVPPPDIDYRHDMDAAPVAAALRRFWPDLPDGALYPDTCGIRPRITPPGEKLADFMIRGPADHGRRGLVHLFGMESPGLTSSLAIGRHVADLLAQGGTRTSGLA